MSLASSATASPAGPPRSALAVYVGRIHQFDRTDWLVYLSWVGTMLGLVVATGGFLALGAANGVRFPVEAWLVPVGAAIFAIAIAIDTIGHRTVYKEALKGGEQLVHHICIVNGVASCMLLALAHTHKAAVIPGIVTTGLSFLFSLIDEAFHWRRYTSSQADPVEMWSHVGIFLGHGIMMTAWWWFYALGYPGVDATLALL